MDSSRQEILEKSVKGFEMTPDAPDQIKSNILDTLKLDQAFKLARKNIKEGSLEQAKQVYQDILSKFPGNKKAQKDLVTLNKESQETFRKLIQLYTQGRLTELVMEAQFILRKYPNNTEIWEILGSAASQVGDLDLSILAFEKVVALKPYNADAHFKMGNVLKAQGKLEMAIDAYKKVISIKPEYAQVFNNMGNILQAQGKSNQAITLFKKVLSLDPYHANAFYNMGNAFLHQGKLEEAIDAYKKGLSIKPDYAEILCNLGIALKDQGKLDVAMEAYKKAISIKPEYAQVFNNMGSILQAQGRLKDAIGAYDKALSINPDHNYAKENIFSLLTQVGKSALNTDILSNQYSESLTLHEKNRPKSNIIAAINSFISSDRSQAFRHIQNFQECDPNLLSDLTIDEKQFCFAYSKFLSALLNETVDNKADLQSQKIVYHLGESHCLSYANRSIKMKEGIFKFASKIVLGGKAFHFARTENNAFKAITKVNLGSIPESSKLFISFGEIDCRPNEGIIAAAAKLNEPITNLIASTVSGYLSWFAKQNRCYSHQMYFLNVPAPIFDKKYSKKVNAEVANTIALFNEQIEKKIVLHGFKMIDLFKFTVGLDGFSDGYFHVDERHLGAKAIHEIEQQLKN